MIYRNQYIERKEVISKTILKICIRKHRRTKNQPEINLKATAGKETNMKLNDLIEKLKMEKGKNGTWGLLQQWIIDMNTAEYKRDQDKTYEKIYGFLWGLEATDYITEEEKEMLQEDLFKIYYS